MTDTTNDRPEETEAAEETETAETLSPETSEAQGALSVPPPVPRQEPGFFRRLFMSRKKQQALAVQNGYLEILDLIRAIRSHLDRQETVQTHVLAMLEKVPETMDRQHEVLEVFKQQLENNMENDQRLSENMGRLSGTLEAMNESQKSSSRTITDLITRSRESEQLLREVMRRAERRMTLLIAFFVLLVLGVGFYLAHGLNLLGRQAAEPAEPAAVEVEAAPAVAEEAEPLVDVADEEAVPEPEAAEESEMEDADAPAETAEPTTGEEAEAEPEAEAPVGEEPEAMPEPEPETPVEAEVLEVEAQAVEVIVLAEPAEESLEAPEADEAVEPKRPRGRPRKLQPEDAAPLLEDVEEAAPAEADEPAAPESDPVVAAETDSDAEPADDAIPVDVDIPEEPVADSPADGDQPEEPVTDESVAESAEELRLYHLKAAIGEAVLDAFKSDPNAPVSLP